MSAPRGWIAVASAEHVRRGHAEGFMQVCHGKCTPLKRLQPGDRVAYYSPTERFRGGDRLQAFTAAGVVLPGEPYAVEMGEGFAPFRRNVQWLSQCIAPIAPLLPRLTFAAGPGSWGYRLRFGLFEVSLGDMEVIFEATASVAPTKSAAERWSPTAAPGGHLGPLNGSRRD